MYMKLITVEKLELIQGSYESFILFGVFDSHDKAHEAVNSYVTRCGIHKQKVDRYIKEHFDFIETILNEVYY